ncbi:ATP-dependent Clp protease proteolytic subunit [Patescibacteria group bacterium AH-259-L07]|nr:ATP-dependent Clp protease proteolytic subunit [Patescibacteria group bacterium AH-259-L07]
MKRNLTLSGLILIGLFIGACSLLEVNPEYLYKPLYGDKDPTFVKQAFQGAAEIASHVSLPENAIVLKGSLTDKLKRRVRSELKRLESDSTINEIILFLYSNGGGEVVSWNLSDDISNCTKPVEVRSCMAYSGAALILASGTKGRRFVYEGSYVMIHQARFVRGPNPDTDSIFDTPEERPLWMDASNHLNAERLAKVTGQSQKRILKDLVKGRWLSAAEAVKYGFADSVLTKPLKQEEAVQ